MPNRPLHVSVTKGADAQLEQAAAQINKDPAMLSHALQAAFPKAMFILMPLFGLLVYALYYRVETRYVPHFYFSVHFHAFAFVALALLEALTLIHSRAIAVGRLLILVALFPYLAIALRRVYGGTRAMTALKTIGIVVADCFLILIAMAAIAYVTMRRL